MRFSRYIKKAYRGMSIIDDIRGITGASESDAIILMPTPDEYLGKLFEENALSFLDLYIPGRKDKSAMGIIISSNKGGRIINNNRLKQVVVDKEEMECIIDLYMLFPLRYSFVVLSWEYPFTRMTKLLYDEKYIDAEQFVCNGILHLR